MERPPPIYDNVADLHENIICEVGMQTRRIGRRWLMVLCSVLTTLTVRTRESGMLMAAIREPGSLTLKEARTSKRCAGSAGGWRRVLLYYCRMYDNRRVEDGLLGSVSFVVFHGTLCPSPKTRETKVNIEQHNFLVRPKIKNHSLS